MKQPSPQRETSEEKCQLLSVIAPTQCGHFACNPAFAPELASDKCHFLSVAPELASDKCHFLSVITTPAAYLNGFYDWLRPGSSVSVCAVPAWSLPPWDFLPHPKPGGFPAPFLRWSRRRVSKTSAWEFDLPAACHSISNRKAVPVLSHCNCVLTEEFG